MKMTYSELDALTDRLSAIRTEAYYLNEDELLYVSENMDVFWTFLFYETECCKPRSAEEEEKRSNMRKVLYKYIEIIDE